MGSNPSKAKRPTPTTETDTTHPRIPQDIVDEILNHLATDSDFDTLRSCALVSKSWVQSCRRYLFHTAVFTPRDMYKWLKRFPVPEESPARLVRDLSFQVGVLSSRRSTRARDAVPRRFFEYTPSFTNVKRVALLGPGGFQLSRMPSSWRLPQSATSLIVGTKTFTLAEIWDVLSQLPNLDDLSLSGYLEAGSVRRGVGSALRGRFGGRLRLLDGSANVDVMEMLLEIPSGLHFTHVEIRCRRTRLLSTVRLVEACSETLVRFSYTVNFHGQNATEAFERSFDFSQLPNLQEVEFGADLVDGGLPWLSAALSTLKPATSPRLSTLRLNFFPPFAPIEGDRRNNMREVADEFLRIEHEYKGVVTSAVVRDSDCGMVLHTLNVRFCGRVGAGNTL